MQVIQTATKGEYGDDSNLEVEVIRQNGEKQSVSFGEGEPEDMSLSRDLNDVYSIVELIKLAYEAGKTGESIEFIDKIEE